MSDKNTLIAVVVAIILIGLAGYGLSFKDVKHPNAPSTASQNQEPTLEFSINNEICKSPNIVLATVSNHSDKPIFTTQFILKARTKERSTEIYGRRFDTDLIVPPHTVKNMCFEFSAYHFNQDTSYLNPEVNSQFVRDNYSYIKNLVYTVSSVYFTYGAD